MLCVTPSEEKRIAPASNHCHVTEEEEEAHNVFRLAQSCCVHK